MTQYPRRWKTKAMIDCKGDCYWEVAHEGAPMMVKYDGANQLDRSTHETPESLIKASPPSFGLQEVFDHLGYPRRAVNDNKNYPTIDHWTQESPSAPLMTHYVNGNVYTSCYEGMDCLLKEWTGAREVTEVPPQPCTAGQDKLTIESLRAKLAEAEKDRDYWKQSSFDNNKKWLEYESVDAILNKFGVKEDDGFVKLKPYQRVQELGMRAINADKSEKLYEQLRYKLNEAVCSFRNSPEETDFDVLLRMARELHHSRLKIKQARSLLP